MLSLNVLIHSSVDRNSHSRNLYRNNFDKTVQIYYSPMIQKSLNIKLI